MNSIDEKTDMLSCYITLKFTGAIIVHAHNSQTIVARLIVAVQLYHSINETVEKTSTRGGDGKKKQFAITTYWTGSQNVSFLSVEPWTIIRERLQQHGKWRNSNTALPDIGYSDSAYAMTSSWSRVNRPVNDDCDYANACRPTCSCLHCFRTMINSLSSEGLWGCCESTSSALRFWRRGTGVTRARTLHFWGSSVPSYLRPLLA